MFIELKSFYNAVKEENIFFFYGEETFFIDKAIDYYEEYIRNNNSINNCNIYNGENIDFKKILSNVLQTTIFDEKKFFIIKNLQNYKDLESSENIILLKKIISECSGNNSLFFSFKGKLEKTSNLLDLFYKHFTFESKKLSESQVKNFILNTCNSLNIKVSTEIVNTIYTNIGNNLVGIYSTLSQLDNKKPLDNVFIDEKIEYKKEFNPFELLTAIGYKKKTVAIDIVNNLHVENNFELVKIIGLFYSFFSKILLVNNSKNGSTLSAFYKNAAKYYSKEDILRIIKSLQFCDEVIKGIKTIPLKPKELLFYFLSNCFL